jgi:hypothetical protein
MEQSLSNIGLLGLFAQRRKKVSIQNPDARNARVASSNRPKMLKGPDPRQLAAAQRLFLSSYASCAQQDASRLKTL